MKKSIFILDICIFGLSITALLIAFFKNLSNVNFLIGAGLISLWVLRKREWQLLQIYLKIIQK